MIDLETMGLRPTSAIVSIGCVLFDQTTIKDKFYTNVSLQSCLDAGLTTDKSTVDWWAKQSEEARSAWQKDDAPSLFEGLGSFGNWLRSHCHEKFICPWGNGSDFDLVLLKSAYESQQAETPWRFYNHHCFRTMKNMFMVDDTPRVGTYHNALDDAITQVNHLHKILSVYNIAL